MSCDGVQKKYKKKRTIANLLQTDNIATSANEKKTYIKEYFEQSPPKSPDSVNESTTSLNADANNNICSGGELIKNEKECPDANPAPSISFKKSKIKDYVFEPAEADTVVSEAAYDDFAALNTSQHKQMSRVLQRRSKIKDYIDADETSANVPKAAAPIEIFQRYVCSKSVVMGGDSVLGIFLKGHNNFIFQV